MVSKDALANVHDVPSYIVDWSNKEDLEQPLNIEKLHMILYYAQAFSISTHTKTPDLRTRYKLGIIY